jgi:glycosyltransferase involved in cell wall biosynthesis
MNRDSISVIIPVFNGEKYILEAIQSVVQQDYKNVEIIVIDDGSTDRSIELVEKHPAAVKIIQQANAGPAAARNSGLNHASGDFIAFLDADDLYPPNKFEVQLEYFKNFPKTRLVAGRIQYIFLEGSESKMIYFESEEQTLVHVHLGSMLTRRSVFDDVGGFDARLQYSEDIEWWLRLREFEVNYVILPEITLQYRMHDANMTRGLRGIERDFMRALRMSLARRRKTGKMHIKPLSEYDLKKRQGK